jgi:uncharacterized protein (DUF362 family)
MPIPHHKFGQTTIAKVSDSSELKQILVDPWLDSETIIVKPNWVSNEPADFTDAETLRMLFEALDSRIVVTESHNVLRIRCQREALNLLKEGMNFTVGNKEVNWKWLLKGDGWKWLVENPDWDWFKQGGHWEQMQKEDNTFLDENGFTDLFREFDVTYVNVTDEVWSGRTADPAEVKSAVESRFKPVEIDKLYSMVPEKLFDLRGSTFISLAKLKGYASFTIKNMFGMIPDPIRPWWHGPKNSRIAASIVDINKVYASLFNVYGMCEALNNTAFSHPEGKFEGTFMGRYNIVADLDTVAFGRDLVSLDAILINIADPSIGLDANVNQAPIDLAEEEKLGVYDRAAMKEAKIKVGDWLTPNATAED